MHRTRTKVKERRERRETRKCVKEIVRESAARELSRRKKKEEKEGSVTRAEDREEMRVGTKHHDKRQRRDGREGVTRGEGGDTEGGTAKRTITQWKIKKRGKRKRCSNKNRRH